MELRADLELALGPVRHVAERLTGFERQVIEDALEVALKIADDEQREQDLLAKEMLELLNEAEESEGERRPDTPPLGANAPTTTEVAQRRAQS